MENYTVNLSNRETGIRRHTSEHPQRRWSGACLPPASWILRYIMYICMIFLYPHISCDSKKIQRFCGFIEMKSEFDWTFHVGNEEGKRRTDGYFILKTERRFFLLDKYYPTVNKCAELRHRQVHTSDPNYRIISSIGTSPNQTPENFDSLVHLFFAVINYAVGTTFTEGQ